jgi:predicted nucleic acid-binding protein
MWVPFFNRRKSPTKQAIDELIDLDRAALIGPILAEVLAGFRKDSEADWAWSAFRGLHYLDVTRPDWRSAASLHRSLIRRGHELPLTDLALAAVALRLDCAVYSIDPHFDQIPRLKRYEP